MATDLSVAKTIGNQMGGLRRLGTMIGAKDFLGDEKSLTFRFMPGARNGANKVRITLDGTDLYKVEFYYVRGMTCLERGSVEGLYDDMIKTHFERETGLYLSL